MKILTIALLLLLPALGVGQTFLPSPTSEQTGYYQVVTEDGARDYTGIFVEAFPAGAVAQIGGQPLPGGLFLAGWYLPNGTYLVLQADNIFSTAPTGVIVRPTEDGVEIVGSFVLDVDPLMTGDLNRIDLHAVFDEVWRLYGVDSAEHTVTIERPNRATAFACRPLVSFSPIPPAVYPCAD